MKDKQLRENGKVSATFALSLNAQEPIALSAHFWSTSFWNASH